MAMTLTQKDRKIFEYMRSGGSVPITASNLKMPVRTVYNSVSKLVSAGYLRLVPGTKSPALYEEGAIKYNDQRARQLTMDESYAKRTVVAANCDHPPCDLAQPPLHSVHPLPDELPGVCCDSVCPEGYVEAHLNGSMSFDIEAVGDFRDPMVDGIGYVGFWKAPNTRVNGSVNRSGQVDIDHQQVTFNYRKGNRGSETFSFRPKRIYVDPAQYQTKDQVKVLFIHRGVKLATILSKTGWRLTNPKIDGNSDIEVAIQNSPLTHLIPQGQPCPGSDIFVDGSHGSPEAEMSHIQDWEKVQIFANLPSHVQEAKTMAREAQEKADAVDNKAEAIHSETAAKISGLSDLLTQLLEVQEKTGHAVLNNTENIAKIANFDATLTDILQKQQAQSYVPPNSIQGRIRWEGYQ